jgi:hypothetical protein
MSIGVDAEDAAAIKGFLVPAPVKVKTPRVRVDFDGDAVLHAGFENLVDIDLVTRDAAGAAGPSCGR